MQEDILLNYLKKQNVSKEIAAKKGIALDGRNRIVIPIRDRHCKVQYNKYRRNPQHDGRDSTEPKYMYDTGSVARLYNEEVLEDGYAEANGLDPTKLIICEGEFKALCFESFGYMAVSGTGGAHTWSSRWLSEFIKRRGGSCELFICFDNDKPGVNATFKALADFYRHTVYQPKVITLLPVKAGKDINDFCRAYGGKAYITKAIEKADTYNVQFKESFTKKSEIKEEISRINGLLEENKLRNRELLADLNYEDSDSIYVSTYYGILKEQQNKLQKLLNTPKKKKTDDFQSNIAIAKSVPIPLLIRFNSRNYAHSIWNEEDRNPSMLYNPNGNWVYDFSTGQSADVIKVYMHLKQVGFVTAINELIKISHGYHS